jgi:SAM-dependent methyltransferase
MLGYLKDIRNRLAGSAEGRPQPAAALAPAPELDMQPILARLDLIEREVRMLTRQLLMPPEHLWRGQPPVLATSAPPDSIVFDRSVLCRAQSFREPYFSYWTTQLGEALRYHRKVWEFVFVCQALHERGMLEQGRRGLGFGVGEEPLSAYFAARGCQIVGTDMSPEAAALAGWTLTAEHAAGKHTLARPNLCPPDVFERNVQFVPVDMNHVPADLTDFDFCWSACALEHLGTIEHGLAFIERSIDTLKPGGVAVHTTEYNISSNEDTVSAGGTVLFRKRDFEELQQRVEAKGHFITPFDFNPGYGHIDRYIDVAPYLVEPHLKLALEGYAITSIGMVIRKKA